MENPARHCSWPANALGMVSDFAVHMTSDMTVVKIIRKTLLLFIFGVDSIFYGFGNSAYADFRKFAA